MLQHPPVFDNDITKKNQNIPASVIHFSNLPSVLHAINHFLSPKNFTKVNKHEPSVVTSGNSQRSFFYDSEQPKKTKVRTDVLKKALA